MGLWRWRGRSTRGGWRGGCWRGGEDGSRLAAGGLSRRPPCPPGTATTVVLSEAGGCGRGARPGMRAVGGAGSVLPAEARQGGTDEHCDRVNAIRGGRDPPLGLGFRDSSPGTQFTILPPPQRPRRRESVLGWPPRGTATAECASAFRRLQLEMVRTKGAEGEEGKEGHFLTWCEPPACLRRLSNRG